MGSSRRFCLVCFLFVNVIVLCSAENNEVEVRKKEVEFVGRMIEQGRTLVHHAVKRFMIILPAIFFKLGIAFTLLVLVTVVAINNGFIGFLLLVVGLSSVLARLQEARRPSALPYINPLPPYYHHAHLLDRSDNGVAEKSISSATEGTASYGQYNGYQYYRPGYSGSQSQAYYG